MAIPNQLDRLMLIANIYPAELHRPQTWSKEQTAERHPCQINNDEFLMCMFSSVSVCECEVVMLLFLLQIALKIVVIRKY